MKKIILLSAAAALLLYGGSALAFHDGGVAYCAGCHTMHNSVDGETVVDGLPQGVNNLLIRANSTDVCLRCHMEGEVVAPGFVPGDDLFEFLDPTLLLDPERPIPVLQELRDRRVLEADVLPVPGLRSVDDLLLAQDPVPVEVEPGELQILRPLRPHEEVLGPHRPADRRAVE